MRTLTINSFTNKRIKNNKIYKSSKCKECTANYYRNRRKVNPVSYALKDRRYALKNAQKRKDYDSTKRSWYKKYVQAAVFRAIKSGALTSMPCQICGDVKTVAHHDDYDKPLEVRWLCRSHHGLWHRDNKALNGE